MYRKHYGWVVWTLLALFMLVMPVWQLMDWKEAKRSSGETVRLLFEVASFQMEVLGSAMNETGQVKTTGQLNEWKRTIYAADYTHERLVQAVGGDRLPMLHSADALLQWIMRLQIAGDRPLRGEEIELMKEVSKRFRPMIEAYGKLMGTDGSLNGTRSGELGKADQELAEYIRKKMK